MAPRRRRRARFGDRPRNKRSTVPWWGQTPTDPRYRGKGEAICTENCTPERGYTQADDPDWQAGPAPAADARGAQGAQVAGSASACTSLASGCTGPTDGLAVGRLPIVLFSALSLLGFAVVLHRRRREWDEGRDLDTDEL